MSDLIERALAKKGHSRRPLGMLPSQAHTIDIEPKIESQDELVKIMLDVANSVCIEKQPEHYRRDTRIWSSQVSGHIGHADRTTWVYQVESAINGAREGIAHSQANGKWELESVGVDFDQRMHTLTKTQITNAKTHATEVHHVQTPVNYFLFVMEFVDVLNAPPIEYHLGRPVVTSRTNIPPELMEMFMELKSSKSASEDQKKIAQQAEIIAELQANMAEMRQMFNDMQAKKAKS